MKPISKEYLKLFNTIVDTINTLDALKYDLIIAQQQAEELYISDPEGFEFSTEETI